MNSQPLYVVDEIGTIVSAVDAVTFDVLGKHINYMYGHFTEIVSRLQQLSNSPDVKDKKSKFPLVALITDFAEEHGSMPGVSLEAELHIIIANISDPEWIAQKRYEENFKPVLYPIYQELLRQIASPSQKTVFVDDAELIQHTKIDRLYWGREGLYGNTQNIMNDFVDAIEIKNLKIKFYHNY
jgi:hypothetical protein